MTRDEVLGAYWCGLKYPFNWLGIVGADNIRKVYLKRTKFGIASGDRRMVDAMLRLRTYGRTMHDQTNLPIEQFRWAFKTYESANPNSPTIAAWMVKRYFAMFVYGQLGLIAIIGGLLWAAM